LKPFLTEAGEGGTYAEAAFDLSTTEGAVKVAVHRLRSRYRQALRATVAATVASEEDVETEIQHCLRALARPPR
jgi:RNA polymerase sigma-70 factor (ECF subfamily)